MFLELMDKVFSKTGIPIRFDENNINERIREVAIPITIAAMDKDIVRDIVKKILETYRALEYYKKDLNDLNKTEWHSWQFSVLLKYLKDGQDLIIPYSYEYFHEDTLSRSKKELESRIAFILESYEARTTVDASREFLCNEIVWTANEVGTILYYLSIYKK